MTLNTDKTKVMTIKSQNITYANLIYENNNQQLEGCEKYLGINIHDKVNWNYNIVEVINGGWKYYYRLENNCKLVEI